MIVCLVQALAIRAGNFEKWQAQVVFNLPIMKYNSYLLDLWGQVPASRAGTFKTLPACHENYDWGGG